jgi:hypothetical protein
MHFATWHRTDATNAMAQAASKDSVLSALRQGTKQPEHQNHRVDVCGLGGLYSSGILRSDPHCFNPPSSTHSPNDYV